MSSRRPKVAVVGHVEWVQFARVAHVPCAGEVVHARDLFEEPAGGGAVAAVQLSRLAGGAVLVTALGEDEHGRRSVARMSELGVGVHARFVDAPTRLAVTLVDAAGERTITTFGPRLEPLGGDAVSGEELGGGGTRLGAEAATGWDSLAGTDAVYFTAGDVDALRAAREASRVLVASPRARDALGHGVPIDALVLSADDEIERGELDRAQDEAALVVFTEGARGGRYWAPAGPRSGAVGRWDAVTPRGEPVDSYGCGDSFAAGLTYGLGVGLDIADALHLAARCGAECLTGRGPYERQLSAADL